LGQPKKLIITNQDATPGFLMIKGKHKIFIPNPHGGKDIGIPLFSFSFELYCLQPPAAEGPSLPLRPERKLFP
jgi:hypothetical protein